MTELTRSNRGAHARLEVLGIDMGRYVPAENQPFDGISADLKDGEDAVWIFFGRDPVNRVTHGIQQVTAVRVRPPVGSSGYAIEVDSQDGARTVLELTLPQAYELPAPAKT
jgi:hypothetical protein